MCDNQQVRIERLDALIWEQVVALLEHPERLRQEYERRLDRLEQDQYIDADTAGLQKQQRHLQQGKSRLIDSYTEGLIDKADFDPKMTQLKGKLRQIADQVAAAKQHHAGQIELFLVINRLEEFAAAVNGRLRSLDLQTQREIIRGLVKRVEIYREAIVVVFRVDPDPSIDADQNRPNKIVRTASIQDRKQRTSAVRRWTARPPERPSSYLRTR